MNALTPLDQDNAQPFTSPQAHAANASVYGRYAAIAAAVLGLFFVIGAVLIPIGGAVIASAEVAPESRIKRIAHPTGGVISEILVSDGDLVEEGDVLIRFENTVSSVDAEFSERSLSQLIARRARLLAVIEGRGTLTFPAELTEDESDEARAAIAAEERRFAIGRQERASLASQLTERVNQLNRQIDGFGAQIEALEAQQALIKPELESVREAFEDGYVTIRRLNELERNAIELEGSIGSLRANIAQSSAAISQAEQQRIQLGQTARADAGDELAQVEAAINQQRVASVSAGDEFDRSEIRASDAGTIDKLVFSAVGEVVRPAEIMLEIVPQQDRLVFNGLVLPSDIDRVATGQPARIRLSALNQATTPELTGEVVFVSADPITDETTGARFFRVRVALSAGETSALSNLNVVSGMPAELFIE
ncbi:MAG: HlyD family type I secretion periplasmic adaptor subunit, partial [Pseudomonadota bacterium]